MYNNPYTNNSIPTPINNYNQQFQYQQLPHYEIIQVNGKAGVDAFKMGPNSSVILVDETADLIWFVRTDGAGYKNATPFTITPYIEKPPVDINALCERVANMEATLNSLTQNNGAQYNEQESNINSNADRRQNRNTTKQPK